MIEYPLKTLVNLGIKDIILITGGQRPGTFLELLKNGKQHGVSRLYYTYQEGSGGIADALKLASPFMTRKEKCVVILGDNYFEGTGIKKQFNRWKSGSGIGSCVMLKEVEQPWHFGVAEVEDKRVVSIEEKPDDPKSNLAILGLYMFDYKLWEYINKISPSQRGELEITDVLKFYMEDNDLSYTVYNDFWSDMGTFESRAAVSNRIFENEMENRK
jgi:glucose-1-phosphate thymidylyltransferase